MLRALLAGIAVLGTLGLMGNMDVEDAVQQDALYCANVHDGQWPDYQGTYRELCDGANLKQK